MGENGDWYNEHGKFEHPRIIKYFYASIRKDEQGYYVYQQTDDYEEKVYFPCKETAIFVFDVKERDGKIFLVLNTTDEVLLDPERLFEKHDSLFMQTAEHLIKFTDRSLFKFSKYIEEKEGTLIFRNGDKSWRIKSHQ